MSMARLSGREDRMAKKYRVTLTDEERGELEGLIGKGKADARKLAHVKRAAIKAARFAR
ncbi:hypothetical protein ACWJKU_06925 [Methylocaldum sp. MU1018]